MESKNIELSVDNRIDTELSLYDIEIDKPSGTVFVPDTGEIIEVTKSNVRDLIRRKKKEDSLNKAKVKELKIITGIEEFEDLHYCNWKSGKKVQFIKIYRTELREYNKIVKPSPHAGLLLFHMQTYIELHTNRIAKPDGSSFTNNELQELTGLGKNTIEKVLNELDDKHYIARVGKRQAREIYFNPYLMCSGIAILKNVVDVLFKDYKQIIQY